MTKRQEKRAKALRKIRKAQAHTTQVAETPVPTPPVPWQQYYTKMLTTPHHALYQAPDGSVWLVGTGP